MSIDQLVLALVLVHGLNMLGDLVEIVAPCKAWIRLGKLNVAQFERQNVFLVEKEHDVGVFQR